jgi:hypothetical protein
MSDQNNFQDPFHLELVAEPDLPMTKIGLCVNKPLADFLSEKDIKSAFVTIIARKNGVESFRKVFSILDGFTHVTYPAPGKYEIEAIVAWANPGDPERHVKRALMKSANSSIWDGELSHYYNDDDEHESNWHRSKSFEYHYGDKNFMYVSLKVFSHSSFSNVIVTDGHFAKPPSDKMMSWISTFYESKGVDQCATRKRKIASFFRTLIQPFAYIFKAMALITFICFGLVYENGFKHIWKPGIRGGMRRVFAPTRRDYSAWYSKPKRNHKGHIIGYDLRNAVWRYGFSLVVFSSSLFAIASFFGGPVLGIQVIVFVFAIMAMVTLLLSLSSIIPEDVTFKSYFANRKSKSFKSDQQIFNKAIQELSCDMVQGDMKNLVNRRKYSATVLYHNAKDKVCRPYAKAD